MNSENANNTHEIIELVDFDKKITKQMIEEYLKSSITSL